MYTEECQYLRGLRTMSSSSSEVFDLARGGRALVTREQGQLLLGEARECLGRVRVLEVQLVGAEALSPSFADEFFGGLADWLGVEGFRARIKVRCPAEAWRVLIQKVLSHRLSGSAPRSSGS